MRVRPICDENATPVAPSRLPFGLTYLCYFYRVLKLAASISNYVLRSERFYRLISICLGLLISQLKNSIVSNDGYMVVYLSREPTLPDAKLNV
jgi:hypothetical protein